jgi:hypothetical protein
MLAAIILIALVIGASLFLFAYFSSFFGNATKNCEVLVSGQKLYCDLQGQNAFVTFTVKNVGSQPVTSLTLTVNGVAHQLRVSDLDPILPGETRGFKVDLPGTYVIGNSYLYSIQAIDVSNNSFTFTNALISGWYTGTGEQGEQVEVQFSAVGIPTSDEDWVINIDGNDYSAADLAGLSAQQWVAGSTHSVWWQPSVTINSIVYNFVSSSGLLAQQGDDNVIFPAGGGSITATYIEQITVTFHVEGLPSDTQGYILSVGATESDTTSYTYSDVVNYNIQWNGAVGSSYYYEWLSPVYDSQGSSYGWVSTTGVETSQSGAAVLYQEGSITATYQPNNLLVTVNFSTVGLPISDEDLVINIDGIYYSTANLTSQQWAVGSLHTYEWNQIITLSGTTYLWSSASGFAGNTMGWTDLEIPSGGGNITATYNEGVAVTFNVEGLPSDAQGIIFHSDEMGDYYYGDLPATTLDFVGTSYTFQWISPVFDLQGNSYVWVSTTGGLATNQSGVIILSTDGNVTATYQPSTIEPFWFDDFETGDYSKWTNINDPSGYIQVIGAAAYEGAYGLRGNMIHSGVNAVLYVDFSPKDNVKLEFMMNARPTTATNNNCLAWFQIQAEGGFGVLCSIYPIRVGANVYLGITWLDWSSGSYASFYETTSYIISENTWYNMTIELKYGDGDGFVKFHCDSDLVSEKTGLKNDFDWGGIKRHPGRIRTWYNVFSPYSYQCDSDNYKLWLESGGGLLGWQYRKSHVINAATGSGTDYQVRITVHYGSGTSSGQDVYLNSHSRTDFGDVRFTGSDGITQLSYWIESKTDGSQATFWVKITDDLSSAPATIFLYYGNSEATTTSNGPATFPFFDDFLGTSVNSSNWNVYSGGSSPGTATVSSGVLTLYHPEYGWVVLQATSGFGVNYAFRTKWHSDSQTDYNKPDWVQWCAPGTGEFAVDASHSGSGFYRDDYSNRFWVQSNGASYASYQDNSFSITSYFNLELQRAGTSSVKCYVDQTLKYTLSTYVSSATQYPLLRIGCSGWGSSHSSYYDWVLVRKCVSSEPAHGTWGSEE